MNYTKDTISIEPLPSHGRFIDLTNAQYGRLTVLGYAGRKPNISNSYWWCECECGTIKKLPDQYLKNSPTPSCCCWQRELAREQNTTHGDSTHGTAAPEYAAYINAKDRCNNPRNKGYKNYGERGIEFRFESYEQFIAHIGYKPSGKYSLERKDNNGHYEIGNVKWATIFEQSRNKRSGHYITINNQTKLVTDWAEVSDTKRCAIFERLRRGFCAECAVFLPIWGRCHHR